MRHLSVLLTLALVASSSFAGVVDTTDPPDIRQLPNSATVDAFNLNDYFATNNAGAAAFTGADADGSVDVAGAAAVGLTDLSASIAVGGDSADVSFTRKVSSFMLSGGSMPGDAMFVQCLRAGVAASSAAPLTGGPAGGGGSPGGGTPGGETPGGSAAWMITFANVSAGTTATGLATRTSAVTASGQDSLTAGGLTASIDAMGNYTLSSDASFAGPVVVTFVKKAGDDMDSASVVAAAAESVGANFAGNLADGKTLTSTGAAVLDLTLGNAAVSGKVRLSVDYVSDGAGVTLGAMDLDTYNGGGQNMALIQLTGAEVQASGTLVTTMMAPASGVIVPFVQVASAGTVTFSNLQICTADADTTYAVAANALGLTGWFVDTPVAGDFSGGIAEVYQNLNAASDVHNAVVASSANNFDTPGTAGSIALEAKADGSLSNASVLAAGYEGSGVLRVVCHAQRASGDSGFLALVLTAMGADAANDVAFFATFVDSATLATGGWTEVDTYGAVSDGSFALIATVQNAGGDSVVNVDDLAVYTVLDTPETFDATLLGM